MTLLGAPITRTEANFVRNAIGFAVSGIPPVAGTPNVVFKSTSRHLVSPDGGASLALRALRNNS